MPIRIDRKVLSITISIALLTASLAAKEPIGSSTCRTGLALRHARFFRQNSELLRRGNKCKSFNLSSGEIFWDPKIIRQPIQYLNRLQKRFGIRLD
jgi:hypothetical protein